VIQESARTTVSQKNTVARTTGHFSCVLIDFHSQTPEAWCASCKSGFRPREAGRQFFIRLQMNCDLGVSRFLRNLPAGVPLSTGIPPLKPQRPQETGRRTG